MDKFSANTPVKHRMLIVDDDPVVCLRLRSYFTDQGFNVGIAHDGEQMWQQLKQVPAQIILLDIGLTGKDGLQLAREIRALWSNVGIIMVTGRDEEVERIVGLESGADDYVTKPFSTRELLARVKNLLRRLPEANDRTEEIDQIKFSGWLLHLKKRRLLNSQGQAVSLTKGEFEVLSLLARHPYMVLTRERLSRCINGHTWDPTDRTIDVLIRRLRKKIEYCPEQPEAITTVRGEGYVFTADLGDN